MKISHCTSKPSTSDTSIVIDIIVRSHLKSPSLCLEPVKNKWIKEISSSRLEVVNSSVYLSYIVHTVLYDIRFYFQMVNRDGIPIFTQMTIGISLFHCLFSFSFINLLQGPQTPFHKEIIILIIYIIALEVFLRFYITLVVCFKNSLSMRMHKSSRIGSVISDSIRPNYVPIFIRGLWTLSLMAEIYRMSALALLSLPPSQGVLERCGSNIMTQRPSSVLTLNPTSSL